jgi:hypothetical protein
MPKHLPMRLFIVILLLLPLFSLSQKESTSKTDSVSYYNKQLQDLYRETYDSMRNTGIYKTATERLKYYERFSANYTSFMVFTELDAANFDKFNASIAIDGYSKISEPMIRYGIGVSMMNERIALDYSFFILGKPKSAKKGTEHIHTSFANILAFDLGYDLTKSRKINIYPYAGLSFRTGSIEYSKPVELNNSFTNISNLVQNNQSTTASYFGAGYQAGVGFDFVIAERQKRPARFAPAQSSSGSTGGIILFIKGGTNGRIGKERYRAEGIKYEPGIKYGAWMAQVGLKFFGRNN